MSTLTMIQMTPSLNLNDKVYYNRIVVQKPPALTNTRQGQLLKKGISSDLYFHIILVPWTHDLKILTIKLYP